MASFNGSVTDYERLLNDVHGATLSGLRNDNFDTGTETNPGDYPLADETYADLLNQQAKGGFAATSTELRETILKFYSDENAPIATKKSHARWQRVLAQVSQLKAVNVTQSEKNIAGPQKNY